MLVGRTGQSLKVSQREKPRGPPRAWLSWRVASAPCRGCCSQWGKSRLVEEEEFRSSPRPCIGWLQSPVEGLTLPPARP